MPLALRAANSKIPIGLELYSVRGELAKDLPATVTAVAKMGYQVVEFFAPYYQWTEDYAKQVRKLMDDLGIRCNSTHNNGLQSFTGDTLQKAIDLNKILGTHFMVIASSPRAQNPDDWKKIADSLTEGADRLRPVGLRGGYHNHQAEFTLVEGKRPMEIIAAHTPKDFMLQFDVGTCVEMGSDPVAWIEENPGRINSLHLKDWNKEKGYRSLFGEGAAPWKPVFAAAEKTGGVEYYLMEQEGSEYSEFDTAERCLATYRKMQAG